MSDLPMILAIYCRDCRRPHTEPFVHTTAMPIYCTTHGTYHQYPVCDPKPPFCARCGESVFGVINHLCKWIECAPQIIRYDQ